MTLCFKPAIQGFLDGCRKIIGLDACHLYGKYGGVLLVATGLDGQNGLVHLGIMVYMNETIENWKIFLKYFKAILDEDLHFTFISDKQKGISEACEYNSAWMSKDYVSGNTFDEELQKVFQVIRLTYSFLECCQVLQEETLSSMCFSQTQHMDKMAAKDEQAASYLIDERPETWSRSHFSNDIKCEHINNNFSESFNNMIKKIRDKPIITLGQMYAKMVMGLFFKRRNECEKWQDGQLVPKEMKLISKMVDLTHIFELAGVVRGMVYEVVSVHEVVFTVDLPNYCDPVYSVDYYRTTYALEFEPFSAEIDWNILVELINPPVIIRKTGRPWKKRIPYYDEAHHVKKMRKCKKCGVSGHYQKTCAGG
ncbi:uncharacterized protein LOC113329851 [Papaver somniferum]|uniref:uncharacterized protein LOC113329851 n=1 Tax=Papaver somniferum TaxID=3469 RepID=UPI000E703E83|nr:uncharacterized protein LOC113329851 [Papaver somniferum]